MKTWCIPEFDLCNKARINIYDEVTSTICNDDSSPANCDVYVRQGYIDDTFIQTCTEYCVAYGLQCVKAFEDEAGDCEKTDNVLSCDAEFTSPNVFGRKDLICSCGEMGKQMFHFEYLGLR